jgi:chromosome segregation ATPase
MSKLDDRLPAIESLRAQRNALGHEMYGLRTQIARTRNALRKQREAEGRLSGPEPEAVAAAREEIARLEAWLKERAAAERAAAGPIARRAEAGRRVDFLDRSLASLRARLESLERLLDNASGARPKDHTLIAELSASIAAVREQIADLERSLEAARGAEQSLAAEARVARETVQRIAA